MTPEQQRIAIAESCGFKIEDYKMEDGNINVAPLPDYLNDLNAMREVEKMLLPDDAQYSQCNFYASELGRLTGNNNGQGWKSLSNDDCFNILHAKAAQRAEAFLRTLNLWK